MNTERFKTAIINTQRNDQWILKECAFKNIKFLLLNPIKTNEFPRGGSSFNVFPPELSNLRLAYDGS